jgi:hypothetical protein
MKHSSASDDAIESTLSSRFADPVPMRRGSLTERRVKCSRPGCPCEWRAVRWIKPNDQMEEIKFRPTSDGIIPYIELDLSRVGSDAAAKLPVEMIIQGPLVDPELGKQSLNLLVQKFGYPWVDIDRSCVPLRSFSKLPTQTSAPAEVGVPLADQGKMLR